MPVEPGAVSPHGNFADAPAAPARHGGEGDVDPSAPPPVPRAVTPRAGRGSWTEPRVRFWWLTAGVLLAFGAFLLLTGYLDWRREVWLIEEGLAIEATVWEAHQNKLLDRPLTHLKEVTLEYTVDGVDYAVNGYRKGEAREVYSGRPLALKVDPDNPTRWTDRTSPPAMMRDVLPGLLVLPVVPFLALAAWAARRRVLRLWRDGEAVQAVVLERRQTPLAPRSRLVRCTPVDPNSKFVLTVYLPPRAAHVQAGDVIWALMPDAASNRAVAAAWVM